MEIIIADYSGFCGGVRRSVDLANTAIEENDLTFSVGPLIHNPQLVSKLEKNGLKVVDKQTAKDIKDSSVLIRAHGESADFKDELLSNGNIVIDATCPVLTNIYKQIIEKEDEGFQVVIVGDKTHPEIIAMESFLNHGIIVSDETEEIGRAHV